MSDDHATICLFSSRALQWALIDEGAIRVRAVPWVALAQVRDVTGLVCS